MIHKRIIILGAGISGLTAAYTLRHEEILLVEKEQRAGGWCTIAASIFRRDSSPALLSLIRELQLEELILPCPPSVKERYLLFRNRLEKVPTDFIGFLRSPLLKGIRWRLLNEWRAAPRDEDETLLQFATRRCGEEAAWRLFDPLAIGVFATSSANISISQAFPLIKEMEKKYGSLTKALLMRSKPRSSSESSPLIGFEEGLRPVVDKLVSILGNRLHFGEEALALERRENLFILSTNRTIYTADIVIVALPPKAAGKILQCAYLQNLKMTSLSIVRMHYADKLLPYPGFGYLVSSRENLPLLGVIFDSAVMPSKTNRMQTRLTAMLAMSSSAQDIAMSAIRSHLHIHQRPAFIEEQHCHEALYLPTLEHRAELQRLISTLPHNLILLGNYLEDVSVNGCIRYSRAKCLPLCRPLPSMTF